MGYTCSGYPSRFAKLADLLSRPRIPSQAPHSLLPIFSELYVCRKKLCDSLLEAWED